MLIRDKTPPAAKTAFERRIPEPYLSFRLSGMQIRGVPHLQ
jgi:hypothetical protein